MLKISKMLRIAVINPELWIPDAKGLLMPNSWHIYTQVQCSYFGRGTLKVQVMEESSY